MAQFVVVYPDIEEQREFRRAIASVQRKLPSFALHEVLGSYDLEPSQMPEVVRFLFEYSFLVPLLLNAIPHLRKAFDNCPVFLKVEKDPDEGFEELFGVVMLDEPVEKALELLARFDREWFIPASKQTHGRLNFTVDTTYNESL